jgi:hypothetical protein
MPLIQHFDFTKDFEHLVMASPAQDIHISCAGEHTEVLVEEFKRQFANDPDVEVYDWGWSGRFRQGYLVLTWRRCVPPEFERQLDADPRLEGYTLYNLSEHQMEPLACN